jgi:hypothetical protein
VAPVIAAAVFATTLPAIAADDASALLAKHKAYMGWSLGDGTYKSMTLEGTYAGEVSKKPLGSFKSYQFGLARRVDYTSDRTGQTSSTGFTGRVFWQTNINNFVTKVIGDSAKWRVSDNLLFDEATTQLAGKVTGSQTIDGSAYTIVRVGIEASFPIDLYIDPSTGAYRRAIIDPDGAYRTVFDFTATLEPLPGKKIISGWNSDSISYTVSKATPNAEVADDNLIPPKPSAKWEFGNGTPFAVKVTANRIYLTATVNGVEGHFILDTGASIIILSDAFATRVGAETVRSTRVAGIGSGSSQATIRRVKTIEFGDNKLSNVLIESIDSQLFRSEPDGADGLIGFDALAGALVALNLDDSNMSMFDPTQNQPDPTKAGAQVVVEIIGNHILVPMRLNGKIDVRAILDTGNHYYVIFPDDLVFKDKLSFLVDRSRIASQIYIGGVSGAIPADCGQLNSLQLGPFNYTTPPGCMTHGSLAVGGRTVLIGFDFLKHFNYLFDYPEGLLYLTARKTEPK